MQVKSNRGLVDDDAPDSFFIALHGLVGLVEEYGAASCQVQTAASIVKHTLPEVRRCVVANFLLILGTHILLTKVQFVVLSNPVPHFA